MRKILGHSVEPGLISLVISLRAVNRRFLLHLPFHLVSNIIVILIILSLHVVWVNYYANLNTVCPRSLDLWTLYNMGLRKTITCSTSVSQSFTILQRKTSAKSKIVNSIVFLSGVTVRISRNA